ncbi:MAG: Holliday junction resolvase Hjc [Candidatus Pacearchaeota archaeon]
MPKNKSKGSNAERDLFRKFVENDYRAVRVAGSGQMENADCDLIAGKKGKSKYSVEVKSSRKPYKYISKEQIENFKTFSDLFGLKPVIALKFFREDWIFITVNQMRDSGKNFVISLEEAKKKGKKFSDFFK